MLDKKKTLWYRLLIQDFNWLKFCFCLMTFCLLYTELQLFFVDRPTLTSTGKVELSPGHFPEILICPKHGYNKAMLDLHGYETSFHYSAGVPANETFYGWRGNLLNYSVKEVMERISLIKDAR